MYFSCSFRIWPYNVAKMVTLPTIQDGRHRHIEILWGRLYTLKTSLKVVWYVYFICIWGRRVRFLCYFMWFLAIQDGCHRHLEILQGRPKTIKSHRKEFYKCNYLFLESMSTIFVLIYVIFGKSRWLPPPSWKSLL